MYAINNINIFYLVYQFISERTNLIEYLKGENILSVFHY